MIGITLCSGIGAPEIAAPWVDWRLASEIEPFPREVLKERLGYKEAGEHNQGEPLLWGDMTEVKPELLKARGIPLPDILVAGTPCQAFSIAGLRKGTEDARGNLTLKFVETCHAIVNARPNGKLAVLWENVPGVLSDKGNAFGCFLGGLVGADDAFQPPKGESWPKSGMVSGPRARLAWRVLDAQYFGVPQRRRRVFVVIDFGNCIDPAAVLFERKGMSGNTPPRRKTGQDVAGTLDASAGGASGKDWQSAKLAVQSNSGDVSYCLSASAQQSLDAETETLIAQAFKPSHFTRDKGDQDPVVFSAMPMNSGKDFKARQVDVAQPLMAGGPVGGNQGGDYVVAFDCKGTQVQHGTIAPPLRSMGHNDSHANAGGHAAIAIQERAVSENPNAGPDGVGVRDDDTAFTLEARPTTQAVAFAENQRGEVRLSEVMPALSIGGGKPGQGYPAVSTPVVRRLMPVECARLQGFSDDHTEITYRGKPAADGPQYKAYGNSMAVPCIKWITDRMKVSMEAKKIK